MGSFLARVLAEQDGTPSTKRICYALSVVAVLAFTGGYILREGMDDRVVDLAKTVLYVTGGAYGVGRFAEKPGAPQ